MTPMSPIFSLFSGFVSFWLDTTLYTGGLTSYGEDYDQTSYSILLHEGDSGGVENDNIWNFKYPKLPHTSVS